MLDITQQRMYILIHCSFWNAIKRHLNINILHVCENAHYDMIVKIAKVFFPSMIVNIREKLKCRFFSSTIKLLQKKNESRHWNISLYSKVRESTKKKQLTIYWAIFVPTVSELNRIKKTNFIWLKISLNIYVHLCMLLVTILL